MQWEIRGTYTSLVVQKIKLDLVIDIIYLLAVLILSIKILLYDK